MTTIGIKLKNKKYNALKEVEERKSKPAVTRKNGIPKKTFSKWTKNQQNIFEVVKDGNEAEGTDCVKGP